MIVEHKNSVGFGSHKGVKISVIYHTYIETCKLWGVSTLEYFKEFFNAASKREQTESRAFSLSRVSCLN